MSTQSNLQSKISNLSAGKIIDVSAGYNKTMEYPTVMRKKFGIISTDLGNIFGLTPIPIVSNNLETYEIALLNYGVSNVEAYLNAWKDLQLEGNIRLNEVKNMKQELQLADKASHNTITSYESKELNTLKTSRSPIPFSQSVVQGGLSATELQKLENLSTKSVLSPRQRKEYSNLLEKRRTNTLEARNIIGQNIAKEMAEGKSRQQSIAIALSEARRAGLDIPYPNSPKKISQSSKLPYPIY